eukprot:13327234-Heterocapsa_arctica.AAC.1
MQDKAAAKGLELKMMYSSKSRNRMAGLRNMEELCTHEAHEAYETREGGISPDRRYGDEQQRDVE